VRRHVAADVKSLVVISSEPALFGGFLTDFSQSVDSFDTSKFLSLDNEECKDLVEKFNGCLLVLRENQFHLAHELIQKIKPLIAHNSPILVFGVNGHGAAVGMWFTREILHEVTQFYDPELSIEGVNFVAAGWLPWIALRGMQNAFRMVQRNWLWIFIEIFVVGILTAVSSICNLGRGAAADPPNNQFCSSLAFLMRKNLVAHLPETVMKPELLKRAVQRYSAGARYGRVLRVKDTVVEG